MTQTAVPGDVTLSVSSQLVLWLVNDLGAGSWLPDLEAAAARCPYPLTDIDWPVVRAVLGCGEPVAPAGAAAAASYGPHLRYANPSVIRQIVKNNPVGESGAVVWFQEMLKFLTVTNAMIEAHGQYWPKAPPLQIDLAWHEFILHTEDYAAYCTEAFGRFLDHHPSATPDGPREKVNSAVVDTRVLLAAQARYGPLDRELWPSVQVGPDGRVLGTAQL